MPNISASWICLLSTRFTRPKAERFKKFVIMLRVWLAYLWDCQWVSQEALQDIMHYCWGRLCRCVTVLRSMRRLIIEQSRPHYGLAADYYTRFTSQFVVIQTFLFTVTVRDCGRSKEMSILNKWFQRLRPSLPTVNVIAREKLSVKSEAHERLSMENALGESVMQLYQIIVKFGLFVNCQTQLKAWFTSH